METRLLAIAGWNRLSNNGARSRLDGRIKPGHDAVLLLMTDTKKRTAADLDRNRMLFKTFKRNKRRLINVVMKYRFGRFKPEILSKLLPSEQSNAYISEMIEAKTPFFAG